MKPSLGTFAKILHVYPYIRLSLRMEELGFYWTEFHEI